MSQKPDTRRVQSYLIEEEPDIRTQKRRVTRDIGAERRVVVSKVVALIWLAFGVLDVLLLFRLALKLINANPNNAFADFIYDLTALFVKPFVGIVESPTSDGMILEIPVLAAIIVYSLVAWVLARLVWVIFYRPDSRVISTFEERET
ncbi:MAG: YggT family protein [Chloroflexi bacterium]|nr:YggT family protein [Chloroflexota bacterium]